MNKKDFITTNDWAKEELEKCPFKPKETIHVLFLEDYIGESEPEKVLKKSIHKHVGKEEGKISEKILILKHYGNYYKSKKNKSKSATRFVYHYHNSVAGCDFMWKDLKHPLIEKSVLDIDEEY